MDDKELLRLARLEAKKARCLGTHIGAVIVKNGKLLGKGCNGPPTACDSCDLRCIKDPYITNFERICPRKEYNFTSGGGLEICPAIHAEQKAIHDCFQNGNSPEGALIAMTCGVPCSRCFASILDVGIKEIIVTSLHFYDIASKWLMLNSRIHVRTFILI